MTRAVDFLASSKLSDSIGGGGRFPNSELPRNGLRIGPRGRFLLQPALQDEPRRSRGGFGAKFGRKSAGNLKNQNTRVAWVLRPPGPPRPRKSRISGRPKTHVLKTQVYSESPKKRTDQAVRSTIYNSKYVCRPQQAQRESPKWLSDGL